MPLSPSDQFAIQQLLNRYCLALDFSQPDAWISCFAEDGSFESLGLVPEFKGSEQLRELAGMLMANNGDTDVRHLTVNSVIDGDGGAATALSYCVATRNRAGFSVGEICADIVNTGVYQDQLVRIGDEWKIAARVHNSFPKGSQYAL